MLTRDTPVEEISMERVGSRGPCGCSYYLRNIPAPADRLDVLVDFLNWRIAAEEKIPGLCNCGCGQTTRIVEETNRSLGVKRGEHYRFIKGHCRRLTPQERLDRFMRQVVPDGDCLIWQGKKTLRGYGRLSNGVRVVGVHRWNYERVIGTIPDGLTLDHLCRRPPCVNPEHLEPVTLRVNIFRGNGVSVQNARKTHCVHGHAFTPENIFRRRGSRECRQCRKAAKRIWNSKHRVIKFVSIP